MTRKTLAVVLIVVIFSAFFTSCTPKENLPQEIKTIAVNQVEAEVEENKPESTAKTTLHVLNWSDYLDEHIGRIFQNEYQNIELDIDTAQSNEEMIERLSKEDGIYDVCILSDYAIERLGSLGLLEKLDKSKLPNFINVDLPFLDRPFDPGNGYSVPYFWGTIGILYNKKLVSGPVDSWNVLFDERYAHQILMYDSMRDAIGIALKKLGYSMSSKNPEELAKAEAELIAQKRLVSYGSDDVLDKMIAEEAALCVVYSGDAMLCMQENPDLDYVIPKEGSNIWIDSLVILKNGKNKDAAYELVDFLKRGYISQLNTEYIGYSTPDRAVLPFLNEELKKNPVYNPPATVLDRCEGYQDLGGFIQSYNEAWERITTAEEK